MSSALELILLSLVFFAGVIGGPIVVARLWPNRSSIAGDAAAGQSGVSPIYWGSALGLSAGYLAIAGLMVLNPPIGMDLFGWTVPGGLLFGVPAAGLTPLIVCGFHRWRWDAQGLELQGVFRRRKFPWSEIASLKRTWLADAWSLRTTTGATMNMSDYVVGHHIIMRALAHYRPDLASRFPIFSSPPRR